MKYLKTVGAVFVALAIVITVVTLTSLAIPMPSETAHIGAWYDSLTHVLPIASEKGEYPSEVALGNIEGISAVNKFGANLDVDAAAAEDLSTVGGVIDESLTATPALVYLVSDDTDDVNAVGTFTMADAGTEDEVLLIGVKTYTLRDASPVVDGHVLREVAATDTIDNIIAAINLGAGAGTKYAAATTANAAPTTAVAGAGDTMTLYAETAIVTTSTVNSGFGDVTAIVGTGARTTTIYGLDTTGVLQSETIDNRGVTPTPSTGTYSFLYNMEVTTRGTNLVNDGLLTLKDVGASITYIQIQDTLNKAQFAAYRIPLATKGLLHDYYYSFGPAPPANVDVECKLLVKPTGAAYLLEHQMALVDGTTGVTKYRFPFPLELAALTTVKLTADTDTNDTQLYGGFTIELTTQDN